MRLGQLVHARRQPTRPPVEHMDLEVAPFFSMPPEIVSLIPVKAVDSLMMSGLTLACRRSGYLVARRGEP